MEKEPILFRGFNEQGLIRIYDRGILPHWRQSGCTYFVTFRLADSIPRVVLQELEEKRTLWLKAHAIDPQSPNWKRLLAKLPTQEQRHYEQLVGRLVNQCLDECHGACVLRTQAIASKVASALDFFHSRRVMTGDYVIMPNHVHILLTPLDGYELEDILHSVKSYTANEINHLLNQDGNLWPRESHDHIVRNPEQLHAYQEYFASNPAKAKLRPGEYIRSQAQYLIDGS